MNETIILTGILLVGVLGLAVGFPFWAARRQAQQFLDSENNLSVKELEDRLRRMIDSIRDLDFDFDTSKIPETDYIDQRKLMIGRGVSLLIQLDEARREDEAVDDKIEDLIVAYRQSN